MALNSFIFRHSKRVARAAQNAPPFARGECSHGVALLQAGLIQLGKRMPISTRNGHPDGIFGNETAGVVRAFQGEHGLLIDGIAGRKTITKLDELLSAGQTPPRQRPPRPRPAPPTPPGPSPSPSPPSPAPFTPPADPEFMVGTGDPPLGHDPGAGPWNSKPTEIGTSVLHGLMMAPAFNAAAAIAIGDDAVKHLMHYNLNSGRNYTIDLVGMIDEVPSAKRLYSVLADKIKVYIEKFPPGTYDITSKRTWGGYNLKSENKNWFFAVGGYSAWIKGRATVTANGGNKSYSFDGQYKFYDRYNWDGGKSVTIADIEITDEAMGEFHRQGLSKEYDEVGACPVRFQWNHGAALSPEQLEPVASR